MEDKKEKEFKNPFFNEKDINFLKLTSKYDYFDLFSKKNIKCEMKIPETILFNNGIPKYWFFNSKKDKSDKIIKKNADKVNYSSIVQILGKIKNDREKTDNLLILKDQIKLFLKVQKKIKIKKF